jgi:hypothetical protein
MELYKKGSWLALIFLTMFSSAWFGHEMTKRDLNTNVTFNDDLLNVTEAKNEIFMVEPFGPREYIKIRKSL